MHLWCVRHVCWPSQEGRASRVHTCPTMQRERERDPRNNKRAPVYCAARRWCCAASCGCAVIECVLPGSRWHKYLKKLFPANGGECRVLAWIRCAKQPKAQTHTPSCCSPPSCSPPSAPTTTSLRPVPDSTFRKKVGCCHQRHRRAKRKICHTTAARARVVTTCHIYHTRHALLPMSRCCVARIVPLPLRPRSLPRPPAPSRAPASRRRRRHQRPPPPRRPRSA